MAYPDINAVMENCSVRATREIVWKAFNNRAVEKNSPILEEAVVLRNEKAVLFGFKTWAEYRLQNRMAKSPKNVASMYESLIPKLQKAAEVEKIELAIALTRITLPFLLFVCLSSFFSAILNSHNKFAAASAAPIILNIVLISILFFGKFLNDELVYYLSYGCLLYTSPSQRD